MGWRLETDHLGLKHLIGIMVNVFFLWVAYAKPAEREPITSAAGRMIYMSQITSPAWSVGGVVLVVFGSFGCLIVAVAFIQKIYRHFKG